MDRIELRKNLTSALQEMYDMEMFTLMIEFCQGEFRVLLYLHMHDKEEIYPSDLSDSLNVTRQRITSILSALRKKGYVHMVMSEKDRRKMQVILTNEGRNQITVKEAEIDKYFDKVIDGLGESNAKEMTRLTNLIITQLKNSGK